MQDRQTTPIPAARALREQDAAAYCGFSGSYFRNTRVADMRRAAKGEPIVGPRWVHFGAAVRYVREDLDAWIDAQRVAPKVATQQ